VDKTKYSVLVVDDDAINIAILTDILESEFTVYAEDNGLDALKAAEKHLPDAILLDVVMPGMDGYAVIAELKKNMKTSDIPVIFATGRNDTGDEEHGLALGAADYIVKPYAPSIVKLRIQYQIEQREQRLAIEYDIMKYKLTREALNIALWDMIVIDGDPINPNNEFTWSPEFRHMLGFTDESDFPNLLSSWSDRLHPADKKPTLLAFETHINDRTGKTPYNLEYHLKMKSGEYRYFHAFGTTLRACDGVPIRVAGALMDITEKELSAEALRNALNRSNEMLDDLRDTYAKLKESKEKTREAEESSQAKSNFLAMMSHEIRTPMNSIMGFAELAMAQTCEPQNKEYLNKIMDATKWLLHIVNDILDISKIESGKMDLDHVPFDLHDLIASCQTNILPSVKEKELDLKVYSESPPNKKVVGDPIRLYQALMNLLSNAVKFTKLGTIKLSSSIKETIDDKTRIRFEVKDSGIGMSVEQVKEVFDPFNQANLSTTRSHDGAGLGLAITKNLVDLMGGKLAVETTPGAGCTFSFEITFDTTDINDAPSLAKVNITEKPHFNGLVLVCDDNAMNRQIICEHIANVGLETITAENGEMGVNAVRERVEKGQKPFDLILMDIYMPIMDGIDAAQKITILDTGTPVIAMTANIIASDAEKYKRSGMQDSLDKPFTTQELWHLLLKYLTPVSSSSVDKRELKQGKDMLLIKLKTSFVKNNQSAYDDIAKAIADNNNILAYRLVQTFKGNVGQIGETELQKIAAKIERQLKNEAPISEEDMNIFKSEFTEVISELKPLLIESGKNAISLNAEEKEELFDKLELMFENINPECIDLLDELRAIPGTEELAQQIENYDFESAIQTLNGLRGKEVESHG
jgi:signal transduction histidine kinase/DNA-binding response OmpR family regulator